MMYPCVCGNSFKENLPHSQLSESVDNILSISPKVLRIINTPYRILHGLSPKLDDQNRAFFYINPITDSECIIDYGRISSVEPIHHSLCCGKRYCFRIIIKDDASDPESVVFECDNHCIRDTWINEIRNRSTKLSVLSVQEENSLKIGVQEARNLMYKNRYYCEIKLDDVLYARTSVKEMKDILFWGEEFEFTGLSSVNLISLSIWKFPKQRDKCIQPVIVCQVNIPVEKVNQYYVTEKWYSPSPISQPTLFQNSSLNLTFSAASNVDSPPDVKQVYKEEMKNQIIDTAPLLRVKSRYFPLKVLDMRFYASLNDFVERFGADFLREIEPRIKAKYREELVLPLVQLTIKRCGIEQLLSDLIVKESQCSDINLILRGNSMASKAIECFLKLECHDYLKDLLSELIRDVFRNYKYLEIDRARLIKMNVSVSNSSLKKRYLKLEKVVDKTMKKIFNSLNTVPYRVRLVFAEIRRKLVKHEETDLEFTEKVVSACFFLRLVCPAIMTPYLFNLLPEYSENFNINRAFTLVAKCIQNVANFASINDVKENYMQSMIMFCRDYYQDMQDFLRRISDPNFQYDDDSDSVDQSIRLHEISLDSARLCYHIDYCLTEFCSEDSKPLQNEMKNIINQMKFYEGDFDPDTLDKIKFNHKERSYYDDVKHINTTNTESSGYSSTNEEILNACLLNSNNSSEFSLVIASDSINSYVKNRGVRDKKTNYFSEGVSSSDDKKRKKDNPADRHLRNTVKIERQKLKVLKELGCRLSWNNLVLDESVDSDSRNIFDKDQIMASSDNFCRYIDNASSILDKPLHLLESDEYRDQLNQIIQLNTDLQVLLLKLKKQ